MDAQILYFLELFLLSRCSYFLICSNGNYVYFTMEIKGFTQEIRPSNKVILVTASKFGHVNYEFPSDKVNPPAHSSHLSKFVNIIKQ